MKGKRGLTGHRVGAWHGRAKYPSETVAEARRLAIVGFGYKRIGKMLGVPWSTVADWVRGDTRMSG
jgi:hypothetical protein